MKKLLVFLFTVMLLAPLTAYAAGFTINVPTKNDDNIVTTPNEDEGTISKKFPVYATQSGSRELKSVTIKVSEKSESILRLQFEGVAPYVLEADNDTATFAVPSGTEGSKDKKIMVGYVVVTLNTAADDCSFKVTASSNSVATGVSVNYIALGAGSLIVIGLLLAVKSKKRMFNI